MNTIKQEIKRISYSEFKNWNECPYRHKLIYIDKLPHYSANEYTAFGSAIHTVCEKVFLNNTADTQKIFESAFSKELKEIDTSTGYKLNEVLISEMRTQAKLICERVLPAAIEHFGDFEVFSIEEEILEEISEFNSYDKKFKGFIDLVIKTKEGRYHIIDWKTCSWGWPTQKKTDPIINYQLTYYKNYFSKKHNIDPNLVDTHFALLKRTAKKNIVEIFRVTSGQKKVENSLKVLKNAVINIERKNSIKNRLSCRYCKFYKTEHCK
jgi:hypothetical protein